MSALTVIASLLTLLAGIGIFLVACTMMSSNLESASSNRLKDLFSKASKSKLLGVGIGALGTAAIQSSGATTVMVIGFVNAGIMSLTQAATIIYGANIGTTITAQIVALGMFGSKTISTTVIFSAFAGLGAFISMFSKKKSVKTIGGILTGFGMLFVGLSIMSGAMDEFAKMDGVKVFLAGINNAVLLVLIGAVFTAIIQSSSVMTSIAIAMVVSGLVTLDQGIFLTMGSNIGSCVVALIAGMTSGKNAKRTSLIHLIFNCSGTIVFLLIGFLLKWISGGITFGTLFEDMFPGAPQTQLAMFHTIFNIATVIIILPLTDLLVRLVSGIIPDVEEPADPDAPRLYYLDNNLLKTAPVAVQMVKNEIVNMASIAMDNFNLGLDVISNLDFSKMDEFTKRENELNFLNKAIVEFVVKLSDMRGLSEKDHNYLATTYRTVRDLERIGDYAENLTEYAHSLKTTNESFSAKAHEEIASLKAMINDLYHFAIKAYDKEDIDALLRANTIEEDVDNFTDEMENNHIERLNAGVCTANIGAQYLSLSSNAERVADHLINVGKSIRNF